MEIRRLSERVLFGSTLADKLAFPATLTDDAPGAPVGVPDFPTRPPELRPDAGLARFRFPDVGALDDDRKRGQVLHFFANHELLALELMALALLRFPDAPKAFRRGIALTMEEEQRHLRLYVERMQSFGVEVGSIPVNTFFWDCLHDMADPTEYVVGMALTFEQANLDYSLFYRDVFAQVGDLETAAVMDEVFEDEIGHVKFGAVWFDRWRNPNRPRWAEYKARTRFPLTPARAKGIGYSAAARRAAGLDDDFIDELSVFSQTKGRTPDVWLANVACEAHLAHAPQVYNPSKAVRAVERDLATLPMYLCAADDVVIAERPPVAWLQRMQSLGFSLPEWVDDPAKLADRRVGALRPWAWSPDAVKTLGALGDARAPDRESFSKAWSAGLAAELIEDDGWHAGDPLVAGQVCRSAAEVEAARRELSAAGYDAHLGKAPFGSAGQGMLRLDDPHAGVAGWIERTLERDGAVVVEPWLDKVLDLSVLFEVTDDAVKVLGATRFLTDGRGHYRGTLIGRPTAGLDAETTRWLMAPRRRVVSALEAVARRAGEALRARGHRGPAGVDALVYRSADGVRFRPLVEINPRHTMGHVALALAPKVEPGSQGVWLHLGLREAKAAGFASLAELGAHLQRDAVTRKGRQLTGGVVCTHPPSRAEAVLTALVVGADLDDCAARLAPLDVHLGARTPGT